MSRKANCYDNAMIESFWSTLKTESTARNHFRTRAQTRLAVFDVIECFYNPRRRHSSIGGVFPVAFETLNNETKNTPPSLSKKAEQAHDLAQGAGRSDRIPGRHGVAR
jgi:transposase InsO family protein